MRIWWVLPVSSRTSHSVAPRQLLERRDVRHRALALARRARRAAQPVAAIGHQLRLDAPIGAPCRARRTGRCARRRARETAPASSRSASLVLANASSPEVSLSMRCTTMERRLGRLAPRVPPRARGSASIAVPLLALLVGHARDAGGLSITTTCASSNTIVAADSGLGMRACSSIATVLLALDARGRVEQHACRRPRPCRACTGCGRATTVPRRRRHRAARNTAASVSRLRPR